MRFYDHAPSNRQSDASVIHPSFLDRTERKTGNGEKQEKNNKTLFYWTKWYFTLERPIDSDIQRYTEDTGNCDAHES